MEKPTRAFASLSFLFASLLLITISCSKQEGYKLSSIKSDLLIALRTTEVTTYIDIDTEHTYNCANFEIDQNTHFDGHEVVIEFKKVKEYDVCLRALGPARAMVEIDPNEISKFKMKLKGKWSTGRINNDELTLDNPGTIKLKPD